MAILKEFMKDVQVISPDATLQEAAKKMRAGNFGMLPVGENDKMIGSISDRESVRAANACQCIGIFACARTLDAHGHDPEPVVGPEGLLGVRRGRPHEAL